MARILILEDDPVRIAAFARGLDGHDLTIVTHAASARENLSRDCGEPEDPKWDVVFLDNDLGGEQSLDLDPNKENCGYAVAKYMADADWVYAPWDHNLNVVVHTLNPAAGAAIMQVLQHAGFKAHRCPWGSFKVNDIVRGG